MYAGLQAERELCQRLKRQITVGKLGTMKAFTDHPRQSVRKEVEEAMTKDDPYPNQYAAPEGLPFSSRDHRLSCLGFPPLSNEHL